MGHKNLVGDLLGALSRGDSKSAARLMTEDFKFSGAVLEPLGKAEYLRVHEALAAALPDFDFHLRDLGEADGDSARLTVAITGTHKGLLKLPWAHVQPAKATGRSIELPREGVVIRFRGEQVSAIEVEPAPGGGLMGILNRLGAKVNIG